jgi:hypothetical protein
MRLSLRATKNWASTPAKIPRPPAPMPNKEFRGMCAQLNITDNETAADLFGVGWRTAQRYWYDETSVPEPLARLIRAAVRHKWSHAELRKLAK